MPISVYRACLASWAVSVLALTGICLSQSQDLLRAQTAMAGLEAADTQLKLADRRLKAAANDLLESNRRLAAAAAALQSACIFRVPDGLR